MKGKLAELRRSFEGHGAVRGVDHAKQQQTKGYTETTLSSLTALSPPPCRLAADTSSSPIQRKRCRGERGLGVVRLQVLASPHAPHSLPQRPAAAADAAVQCSVKCSGVAWWLLSVTTGTSKGRSLSSWHASHMAASVLAQEASGRDRTLGRGSGSCPNRVARPRNGDREVRKVRIDKPRRCLSLSQTQGLSVSQTHVAENGRVRQE
jgi:hypothetical protein